MVMITYYEGLDSDVMELLNRTGLANYTNMTGNYGRGDWSGTHLGDDIWPGD
ncbi:MAG: hypothetical protein HQL30_00885 [Candidatus Omnitrophica bacterium]|nr:hypothetical protein [Candidatus Omnitrophota bacterium]